MAGVKQAMPASHRCGGLLMRAQGLASALLNPQALAMCMLCCLYQLFSVLV